MLDSFQYDTGPIRPPSEAASLLVRLTRGCPWNRCRFCGTYKGMDFETRPATDVCHDIDNMGKIADRLTETSAQLGFEGRMTFQVLEALQKEGIAPYLSHQVALFISGGSQNVFLQDGNSLESNPEDVIAVLSHLKTRFPKVSRITTYARSMTLRKLEVKNLSRIRQAGLTRVHVGLESGADAVLKIIRKGVTPKHHIEGGRAAVDAGLELSEYVMPGVGGQEHTEVHATETARVLNAINPHFIRLRTFYPLPGTGLAEDVQTNKITPLSEDDTVREIRLMIASLDGITSRIVSDHDRNLLMEVEGKLPKDRADILATLDDYLNLSDEIRQLFRVGRRLQIFHTISDLANPHAKLQAERAVAELEDRFGNADVGLSKVMDVRL